MKPRCGWPAGIALRTRYFPPKLHGHLRLALLGGVRVSGLRVCACLPSSVLCFRRGSFDFDLRIVWQRVAARTDDRAPGSDATRHLRKFRVAYADLDRPDLRMAIRTGNDHVVCAFVVLEDRRSR